MYEFKTSAFAVHLLMDEQWAPSKKEKFGLGGDLEQ
jgi:hypothetical protein